MAREIHGNGPASAIYAFGLIGAAVYFISQATSLLTGIFGFVKAIVWPALMVYHLLNYLGV
jgi:amino acid permease